MRLKCLVLLFVFVSTSGLAQTRLEAARARGEISCAAFPRPGLATLARGTWRGLYIDICRAVALAVLGEGAKYEFHPLELPEDVEALRRGDYDIGFLSASEIAGERLAGAILPGPPVFFESYVLMVEKTSPAQAPDELVGLPICFNQAQSAHLALEERFARKALVFVRLPFEEEVELIDAYNSRHCKALVGEATELALIALKKGVNKFESRILSEPLAVFPIFSITPMRDSQWSTIVAWTIHFLQAAERKGSAWSAGEAQALAFNAQDLALDAAWREHVLAAVGDYGMIYERNLGQDSPFKLSRGVNALWSAGGLIAPPIVE